MKTTESAEMYLETILLLQEKHPQVRSIDIVHQTGYSKPSVSRAVGLLKQRSLIDVDSNGYISLTDNGKSLAAKILERHRIITDFLISLGVSPEVADEDACKMEHIISDEVFNRIKEHLK